MDEMAKVVITLRDTPAGGVAVHTVSEPPYAVPATPAQMAAMEIARRTAREYGMQKRQTTSWPRWTRRDAE